MAITGTGTEQDPFIVHSYDEIKQCASESASAHYYLKLPNGYAIDCNEYGADWEWETITANCNCHLDLNGGTIKNIMIKTGNVLSNIASNRIFEIKNGKILNVFCNSNVANIFSGTSLKNISTSINGSGLTGVVFNGGSIENCAVYFKTAKLNGLLGLVNPLVNSDFYLDIADANESGLGGEITISNCRFRGKVKGGSWFEWSSESSPFYSCTVNSCVFDVDLIGMSNTNMLSRRGTTNSTIVNKEKMPSTYPGTGTFDITTAQMKNAEYLNGIGFNVVEIDG